MVQRRPRMPPSRQIAVDIRAKIESGEYEPGFALPSHVALADEYQVTTGTIQKALRILKAEGLIESEPGYGTFVVER